MDKRKDIFHVFVVHAAEDKKTLVRPLVNELKKIRVSTWYDEHEVNIGDSLQKSIDLGLSRSKSGLLVLSRDFFAKQWPQRELAGLQAQNKNLLPIWHNISKEEIADYSPTLIDLFALKTNEKTVDEIAKAVSERVNQWREEQPDSQIPPELLREVLLHGVEIEEFGTQMDSWAGTEPIAVWIMQAKGHALKITEEMDDIHFNERDRREHIIFGYLEPACQTVLDIADTNREPPKGQRKGAWTRLRQAILQTNAACAELMNYYSPYPGIFEEVTGESRRPTSSIIWWNAERMYYCLRNIHSELEEQNTQ